MMMMKIMKVDGGDNSRNGKNDGDVDGADDWMKL